MDKQAWNDFRSRNENVKSLAYLIEAGRRLLSPAQSTVAYRISSPIEFADGLADPLLICYGMVDDNVFFKDTARLAQRLIELKKEDWEVAIYSSEPHGFLQATSWRDEYRRILMLFERHTPDG
jgi:dipeptidyl aminopeptidase/acylaminoacyl peptidase